jgi:hypothetical protein
MKDESIPDEDKKRIETGISSAMGRANKVKAFQENEESAAFDSVQYEDILSIREDKLPSINQSSQVTQKWRDGDYGEGPAAWQRAEAVKRELAGRSTVDKRRSSFADRFNADEPMLDTKTNREDLGAYISDMLTDDMTDEEKIRTTFEQVNKAGFATERMRTGLKAGVRSPEGIKGQLGLFKTLTSMEKRIDLGLTDDEYSDYLFVDSMAEYSESEAKYKQNVDNAIEQLRQGRENKLTSTRSVWSDKLEVFGNKTGQEEMLDRFNTIFSNEDFTGGWYQYDPEENYHNTQTARELQNKFMSISRRQLELGATPDMAEYNAHQYINKMGEKTNINGDYEPQINIPPGSKDIDMRHMKTTALQSIDAGYIQVDGKSTAITGFMAGGRGISIDEFDESKVRLYVPLNKERSRTMKGEVVFEAYYDGSPLSANTDKDQKVLTFDFAQDEFTEKVSKKDILSGIQADSQEQQKNITALKKKIAARKGQNRTSGLYVYQGDLEQELEDAQDLLFATNQRYFDERKRLGLE